MESALLGHDFLNEPNSMQTNFDLTNFISPSLNTPAIELVCSFRSDLLS